MAIKLIALDIDGTLVPGGTSDFTKKTYEIIKKAEEKGIIVCIATGRPYPYAKDVYEKLDLTSDMITMCGSIINDKTGKTVFQSNIPSELTKDMIKFADENNIYFQVFTDDYFEYIGSKDYADIYYSRSGIIGKHCAELLDREEILTPKIIIMDYDEDRRAFIVESYTEKYPTLSTNQSFIPNIEITNKSATKSEALKILAKRYNVNREDIMAIGDSGIDIGMIEYAGVGVAMDDSSIDVKNAADYVTGDYLNDGVAQAILEYCF